MHRYGKDMLNNELVAHCVHLVKKRLENKDLRKSYYKDGGETLDSVWSLECLK